MKHDKAEWITYQKGLRGPMMTALQYAVTCPVCQGRGSGSGCLEQGGWIHGMCPNCDGHGHWLRIDWATERPMTDSDGGDNDKLVQVNGVWVHPNRLAYERRRERLHGHAEEMFSILKQLLPLDQRVQEIVRSVEGEADKPPATEVQP